MIDQLAAHLQSVAPLAASRRELAGGSPARCRLVARALTAAGMPAVYAPTPAHADRARHNELIAVCPGTPPHSTPCSPARFLGVLADVYAHGHLIEPTVTRNGAIIPAAARPNPGYALAERDDGGLGSELERVLVGSDRDVAQELGRYLEGLVRTWLGPKKKKPQAVVAAPHPTHPRFAASTGVGVARMINASYRGRIIMTDRPVLDPTKLDLHSLVGKDVLLVGIDERWIGQCTRLLKGSGAHSVTPLCWLSGE